MLCKLPFLLSLSQKAEDSNGKKLRKEDDGTRYRLPVDLT